jgi:hypothetical protein
MRYRDRDRRSLEAKGDSKKIAREEFAGMIESKLRTFHASLQ